MASVASVPSSRGAYGTGAKAARRLAAVEAAAAEAAAAWCRSQMGRRIACECDARSIEVGLGPERDFSGVDLGLRESAPLVATLLDGDGGDTERENKSSVDPVTTSAAISLWLWTSTCLSTWRLMRHIQRTERIGVFDVHTVSAKLLERQKAGATIGRYWKTHSARFFSNAKKTKRKQDERSLQSYLGKIQV